MFVNHHGQSLADSLPGLNTRLATEGIPMESTQF
jgi:hypothetical protein